MTEIPIGTRVRTHRHAFAGSQGRFNGREAVVVAYKGDYMGGEWYRLEFEGEALTAPRESFYLPPNPRDDEIASRASLAPSIRYCPSCGRDLGENAGPPEPPDDWRLCLTCGTEFMVVMPEREG